MQDHKIIRLGDRGRTLLKNTLILLTLFSLIGTTQSDCRPELASTCGYLIPMWASSGCGMGVGWCGSCRSDCCEDPDGVNHAECCDWPDKANGCGWSSTSTSILTTTTVFVPKCWEPGWLYDGYPMFRDATNSFGRDKSTDINDDNPRRWGCDFEYAPAEDRAAGTGILSDEDQVQDRYWEITPVFDNGGWMLHVDGTRPGYKWDFQDVDDETHTYDFDYGSSYLGDMYGTPGSKGYGVQNCSGNWLPGCEVPRDHYCRPRSLQHQPCIACNRHDNCVEYCFNYDLRYYRQFNINTVWANTFKVTPEFNMPISKVGYIRSLGGDEFIDTEESCMPLTPSIYYQNSTVKLGDGEGPCDSHTDCQTGYCSMDPDGIYFGHCCNNSVTDVEYDQTRECCMPLGVVNARQGDVNYCQKKRQRWNVKCGFEEGHCRGDGDCDGSQDLKCFDNPGNNRDDSACCYDLSNEQLGDCGEKGMVWDGKNCIEVLDSSYKYPWKTAYTRTQEGVAGDGGGPIFLHMAGGGMVPNITEAANPSDPKISSPRAQNQRECNDCMLAKPYIINPSPIWAETRNIGNIYAWDVDHTICGGTCPSGRTGPCVAPDCTVKGWACPLQGRPIGTIGTRNIFCKRQYACGMYDCNCGRDLHQEPNMGECDPILSGYDTSCEQGPQAVEYGCCGAGDFWPGGYTNENKFNHNPPAKSCPLGSSPPPGAKNGGPHDRYLEPVIVPPNVGLIPASCGALKMKQVDVYPRNTPEWDTRFYGGRPSGNSPWSWIKYTLVERPSGKITTNETEPRPDNILPQPTDPWTVLTYYVFEIDPGLETDTTSINISADFTIRNYMNRRSYVEQCMWHGCSRLEVDVRYDRRVDIECVSDTDPDDIISIHQWDSHNAPCEGPPNCCWPDSPCLCSCPDGYSGTCTYRDNCYCRERCWGCWHHEGTNKYFPVTVENATPIRGPDPNDRASRVCQGLNPDTSECIKFEEFTDQSEVLAEEYGKHLKIARPLPETEHVNIIIDGELRYKTPRHAASTRHNLNYSYVRGYITISAIENTTDMIDMFNGFELDIPDKVFLKFTNIYLPIAHDLTSLESALRWDFNVIPRGDKIRNAEFLDLVKGNNYDEKQYITDTNNLNGGGNNANNPTYYIANYNPIKEFLHFYDQYYASTSKYSWRRGVSMTSRANKNRFFWEKDPSYNIGLYRNFRNDETRVWDFEHLSVHSKNIEEFENPYVNDPHSVKNVVQIGKCNGCKLPVAVVKYAPFCDSPRGVIPELTHPCSDVAKLSLTGNSCLWKYAFNMTWPISDEKCRDIDHPIISEYYSCDGAPSKYQSYCGADGNYYAYWMDKFNYRYFWNDFTDECFVSTIKQCRAKVIRPQSYTFLFEATNIHPKDWDKAELTIHTMFRSVKVKPFKSSAQRSQCENDVDCSVGNVRCNIRKPHALRPFLEKIAESPLELYFRVKLEDLCDGTIYG